jgi:hypothetical protein
MYTTQHMATHLRECQQAVAQLMQQTEQANMLYQQMLQQEQQNS